MPLLPDDNRATVYDIVLGLYAYGPDGPRKLTPREYAMIGYSPELQQLIIRCIEANPAMEEAFLRIADLAFTEGQDSAEN